MTRFYIKIIQVEVLLEYAGWSKDPNERRKEFMSLDVEKLSEDFNKVLDTVHRQKKQGGCKFVLAQAS